ncbi:protein of unknown function [Candidatus Nitrosocaldus cavascurensis]|uniref:Uncharacterized protein n=1 Tax=Candidatus Nitrosocaldus cavascurensis TaxID=2058097 RepID=A0A2K5AT98_9ARCH|nr:protein of unknown function [Candidatus Nitrosocaldus cavascurensis]
MSAMLCYANVKNISHEMKIKEMFLNK